MAHTRHNLTRHRHLDHQGGAHLSIVNRGPLIKRLPIRRNSQAEIQTYGADNLYPQMVEEIMHRSHTLKASVITIADFVNGEGFEDEALRELIVNRKGDTAQEMLEKISMTWAMYRRSAALHIQYNLNFQIAEINFVPFRNARLGLANERGNVIDIKVSNNWEKDRNKEFFIEKFDVFNPDPAEIRRQWNRDGFQAFKGQILYLTPDWWVYPFASFDSVLDQAQTQADIGIFNMSMIQNGFMGSKVMNYPGRFKNDEERLEFMASVRSFKGPMGANSTMVVENPALGTGDASSASLMEDLSIPNLDNQYINTEKTSKNAIKETFRIPDEILGIQAEKGIFNQEQVQDAYIYMNSVTKNDRNKLSVFFKKILSLFKEIVTDNYSIKLQQYLEDETLDSQPTPTETLMKN